MKVVFSVLAVLLAGLIVFAIIKENPKMKPHPRIIDVAPYEIDSILRLYSNVVAIRGTGSMQPLIPAGKPDEIVAWAVVDNIDFALLGAGDVVVFTHKDDGLVIHELNLLDGEGWISSGSYNKSYDSGRVTRKNLRGVVTLIYKLKK